MTFRDRIRAVLFGGKPDRVPFAPYANLIPRGDFERELRNRGMGLLSSCSTVWSEMPNVSVSRRTEGDISYTTHHTPVGSVRSARKTHVGRIIDGENVEWEAPVKSVGDLPPVIFMIDDTVYHTDYGRWEAAVREVGADGIVRSDGLVSPYESAYWEGSGAYMSLETWATMQVEHPGDFARLLEALDRRVRRRTPLALAAPGESAYFGWLGGIFGPKQFERNMLPFYREFVPLFEAAGKRCVLHADATKLAVFADLVRQTGVHIVEAFTPPPVGDLSIAEARAAWGPEVVIWVNFPETIFWSGPEETYEYTAELLRQNARSPRFAMGLTEMGTYGVQDDETERVFKQGLLAVLDSIEEHGRL